MPAHCTNTLYYGDNLPVLRDAIATASVDLVYLDPPFNSNRTYNVLFKDEHGQDADAQLQAFEDTWHWNEAAARTYHELASDGPPHVAQLVGALRYLLGTSQMLAYLVMMAARLVQLHRVLTPTGSLYLHCDPTASHYLKIILDSIFGPENFRNEIVWKRTSAHNAAKRYGPVHDSLLFYSKSDAYTWIPQHEAFDPGYVASHYRARDAEGRSFTLSDLTGAGVRNGETGQAWRGFDPTAKGRHWSVPPAELERLDQQGRISWSDKPGAWPRYRRYLDEQPGVPVQDLWTTIDPLNAQAAERLGYPTQKPLALLDRIIQASSNPGDVVLDPFCGCGTAVAAAQQLGRRWIGIDITHLAISVMKSRMREMFPGIQFQTIGEPTDIGAARRLAQDDRYQFQWWALSLVKARPLGGEGKQGKKGADRGIDGIIPFMDDASELPKRALVQVKSGHVRAGDVRDLRGTIERERAPLGALLTLEPPSREMLTEAAAAGYYRSPGWQRDYPRLQVLTIADLLEHRAALLMPPAYAPFKQAQRSALPAEQQGLEW